MKYKRTEKETFLDNKVSAAGKLIVLMFQGSFVHFYFTVPFYQLIRKFSA